MLEGIERINEVECEVPVGYVPGMRVSARFFLSEDLEESLEEGAVHQLANVATLPGIVRHALAMPDIHSGYGFPIGGVAAFREETGIISPGGVGYDINCGVRLLATPLRVEDLTQMRALVEELFRTVPTGVGAESRMRLSAQGLEEMLVEGVPWAVREGYGIEADAVHCEENGQMQDADAVPVSKRARKRGMPQAGTLGSGNHFLEVQVIDKVFDPKVAAVYGLEEGQVCCMIHCGSRGLGHQVCTDHLRVLESATRKYEIAIPDRQLACAPIHSPEGEAYFGAMAAAANYAWVNRQVITHEVRKVFSRLFGIEYEEMPLVYDVAHNVAKREEHDIDGRRETLYVHRKGATRAFGPGRLEVPADYRAVGQPVIIPGSMGSSSYVLHGTDTAMERTFGSTCHGAGRVMSRTKAKKSMPGKEVREALMERGIYVRATSDASIAEEAPAAYKESDKVVDTVTRARLSLPVVRLRPLGVIKG
ncbi:RtcB family protein [Methanofollis formosanus]|uniref:tRNA-splicing ligase RtcB n=1 Tax=Methanofollis formosanus TaxID=299308 RepID=A0A8G1A041_9EURY|nr:RtcB family protein [Methanofollis formosanus]QYZ78248.1 RtcB family protein [Methanofollis formosanus]